MIVRNIFLLCLATSIFWALNAFSDESNSSIKGQLPTFKETTLTSPQDILATAQFQKNLYEESQDFSTDIYWHKLTFPKVTLESSSSKHYLMINYYIIDHLDFYLFHGDELKTHWIRGALQTWNHNTESYRGTWIPITLSNEQDTTLLIRKQGNSPLLTPIELFNEQTADALKEQKQIFWTIIMCSLAVLLAHNFFVFILLRQPGYAYYLGINISIFIALSIATGFSRWIFPEDISQWLTRNLFLIFGIGTWIFYRFSVIFLSEVQIPSSQSIIRKYGDWVFIGFLLFTQFFSQKASASFFALIEVALFCICSYWGIKAYLKGFLAVRFYLFSWLILIIGSILSTLMFWKVLPINIITESILPISSILYLLGFAFAYADRANYLERNRQLNAITDTLTELPNRTYFFSQLPKLLAKTPPTSSGLALIMIEITSHLKLSQAFGAAQADIALSDIIEHIHKKTMTLEGVLPLPLADKNIKYMMRLTIKNLVVMSTKPNELKTQIEAIQRVLDSAILVGKVQFRHQYKIGSALYPSQGNTLDKLYQNALIASNAVTYSSGHWVPFTDKLQSDHAHQLKVVTLLTDDIQNEKLYFEIQPQVNLSNNSVVGGEILIRWRNEHLGQVSPAEFIPLAEQTGLIYKLTDMIIDKSFRWAAAHTDQLVEQTLSINISALDLLQENFAQCTNERIKRYGLKAKQFTIEITETSVFQNNDIVLKNVDQLHKAGFKLAIDDFGVGYSSMQNLVSLQTDELKIDQFFVMNLLNDKQSQVLCQNMINLSRELNITSVAEGIESEEILTLLKSWHCQFGQGYHLHRPMPPADYLSLLEPNRVKLKQ